MWRPLSLPLLRLHICDHDLDPGASVFELAELESAQGRSPSRWPKIGNLERFFPLHFTMLREYRLLPILYPLNDPRRPCQGQNPDLDIQVPDILAISDQDELLVGEGEHRVGDISCSLKESASSGPDRVEESSTCFVVVELETVPGEKDLR